MKTGTQPKDVITMKNETPEPELSRRDFIKKTTADVVIVGAGAAGLPASIRARDRGASVILVDSNHDVGGHAMVSGGSVALGGGNSLQKKFKIEDSADNVYL